MLRVLLVLLLLNVPAAAQLDPDRAWTCWSCYSHNAHFLGGAATDVAVRPLPFLARSWRRSPAGRIGLAAVIGIGWELTDVAWCQNKRNVAHGGTVCAYDQGFGVVDLTYDVAGAIATEIALATARHLWRALHRI